MPSLSHFSSSASKGRGVGTPIWCSPSPCSSRNSWYIVLPSRVSTSSREITPILAWPNFNLYPPGSPRTLARSAGVSTTLILPGPTPSLSAKASAVFSTSLTTTQTWTISLNMTSSLGMLLLCESLMFHRFIRRVMLF